MPRLRRTSLKRKPLKRKPTTTTKADKLFSEYIRKRDGRCVHPECDITDIKKLQCSHFFARAISSVRYDPRNADALCYKHHYGDRIRGWEYLKMSDYRDFKIDQLGEYEYMQLELLSKQTVKRQDAIAKFMHTLDLENKNKSDLITP